MLDIENTCHKVISLIRETGIFIKYERLKGDNLSIESKGMNDYVTLVDKKAEEMLIKYLEIIIPGSGFIAEENTNNFRGETFNWIIDPIDGTTNYIHGLPPFAISVGLMEKEELIMGVIYEIGLDECFYAWKDSPAYLNGKEIHVSETSGIKNSLIATGFPYADYKYLDRYLITMKYFMQHSHGLRRLGSAATVIAYVACGRFEAFYEYGLNPWDVAAGIVILKQAGGRVSDFKGGNNCLFGAEIVASNAMVFDEFLECIGDIMLKDVNL